MSGDFRELFDRHAEEILRYLRRLTASRSDAEEILQDTFLKLHQQLGAGLEIDNVRAWLFRVGTNAARDLARARVVRVRESGGVRGAHVVDFEQRFAEQQLTRRALGRLPRRMRQVLLLWSEGFTYREIAALTAIEPGYVGVLLQRARIAFRRAIEQGETIERGRTRNGVL